MKTFIILVLSSLLAIFMVFGCSLPPDNIGTRDPGERNTTRDNDTRDDDEDDVIQCPSPPKCDRNDCCGDDDDCQDDVCDEYFSSDSKCEDMPRRDAERMGRLFEDYLESPDFDDLRKLDNDDIQLICTAVDKIDYESWKDLIDDYSSREASETLQWISREDRVTYIFDRALDEDEGQAIMEKLLDKAGSVQDDSKSVLKGLTNKQVGDGKDSLLLQIESDKNEQLLEFLHEQIVEGVLCTTGNRPVPVNGPDEYTDTTSLENAEENTEVACFLAVYCYYGSSTSQSDKEEREDLRKYISKELRLGEIDDFIKNSKSEGGLGLSEDNVYEEWKNEACDKLKDLWNDAPDNKLNLGL